MWGRVGARAKEVLGDVVPGKCYGLELRGRVDALYDHPHARLENLVCRSSLAECSRL